MSDTVAETFWTAVYVLSWFVAGAVVAAGLRRRRCREWYGESTGGRHQRWVRCRLWRGHPGPHLWRNRREQIQWH